MKMEKNENKKKYLTAEVIYKYLLELDSELETLILCKSSYINLITTDQSLYEAVAAIEKKEDINFHKLTKLLEVCEIKPFPELMKSPRKVLTEERAEKIRDVVIKK